MHARSFVCTLALAIFANAAAAHAILRRATPANGSTTSPPPATITLKFSARIQPNAVHIDVKRDGTVLTDLGAPSIAADGRTVSISLNSPAPGAYILHWSVVALDGDATHGDVNFTATK